MQHIFYQQQTYHVQMLLILLQCFYNKLLRIGSDSAESHYVSEKSAVLVTQTTVFTVE